MTFRGPFRTQIESCLPSVLECSHYVVSAVFFGKSKERFDKATHSSLFLYFSTLFLSATFFKLTIEPFTLPPIHKIWRLFNCSPFGLLVFIQFTLELFRMLQLCNFSFSTDLLKFKSSSMLIDRLA